MSGRFGTSASKMMPPRNDASVTASRSLLDLMVVSIVSRNTATPTPIANPRSSPSAMSSFLFGDTGADGTSACLTTVTLIGEVPPLAGVSSCATTLVNDSETASAISLACDGDVLRTLTLMSTVFSGADAETLWPSTCGVEASFRLVMTGSSTIGVDTIAAYDFTRCWVKVLPSCNPVVLSEPEVVTNSWVCGAEVGVARHAGE